MKSIRCLVGAVTMLAATGAVVAAERWPDVARPCAAMTDNLARLTCFDQLYAKATAAATAAVTRTAGTAAIGDEDLKKSSAERAESAAPISVDAKVTALREIRPRVFRISLDNGQVWQQEEVQSLFAVDVGDTVRIKTGLLGRHDISRVANGKTGGWARVTRLQ